MGSIDLLAKRGNWAASAPSGVVSRSNGGFVSFGATLSGFVSNGKPIDLWLESAATGVSDRGDGSLYLTGSNETLISTVFLVDGVPQKFINSDTLFAPFGIPCTAYRQTVILPSGIYAFDCGAHVTNSFSTVTLRTKNIVLWAREW